MINYFKNNEEKRDYLRLVINNYSVKKLSFTKKDGSERIMNLDMSRLKDHIKGDDAVEWAKEAAKKAKENHPEMIAVFDSENNGIRKVNLDTVNWIELKDGKKFQLEIK